jgi:hypothetical protein
MFLTSVFLFSGALIVDIVLMWKTLSTRGKWAHILSILFFIGSMVVMGVLFDSIDHGAYSGGFFTGILFIVLVFYLFFL